MRFPFITRRPAFEPLQIFFLIPGARHRPSMFEFNRSLEPPLLDFVDDPHEIELSGSRFDPTRIVGQLDQLDEIPCPVEVADNIAVHRLDMPGVEDQTYGGMTGATDHIYCVREMMQQALGES